jgi:hypothetical protein
MNNNKVRRELEAATARISHNYGARIANAPPPHTSPTKPLNAVQRCRRRGPLSLQGVNNAACIRGQTQITNKQIRNINTIQL